VEVVVGPPGGGGGGVTPKPTPSTNTGGRGVASVEATETPDLGADIGDGDSPLAGFLSDHIRFIQGYKDKTVRPDSNITRAEVAMIIFRLLSDETKHREIAPVFPDVKDTAWHAQAIKYLTDIGIARGYKDGTFKPDDAITRAEFATLVSGFAGVDHEKFRRLGLFDDVGEKRWYTGYVNAVASKDWVSGYPDGTFKPDYNITRAEVVSVINRMLDRGIAKEDIPSWAPSYPDLSSRHWAFALIIEASIGHDYERKENGLEDWRGPRHDLM